MSQVSHTHCGRGRRPKSQLFLAGDLAQPLAHCDLGPRALQPRQWGTAFLSTQSSSSGHGMRWLSTLGWAAAVPTVPVLRGVWARVKGGEAESSGPNISRLHSYCFYLEACPLWPLNSCMQNKCTFQCLSSLSGTPVPVFVDMPGAFRERMGEANVVLP